MSDIFPSLSTLFFETKSLYSQKLSILIQLAGQLCRHWNEKHKQPCPALHGCWRFKLRFLVYTASIQSLSHLPSPHLSSESTQYNLPAANYFIQQFFSSLLFNLISITPFSEKTYPGYLTYKDIDYHPRSSKCQCILPLINHLIAHLIHQPLDLHLTHPWYILL